MSCWISSTFPCSGSCVPSSMIPERLRCPPYPGQLSQEYSGFSFGLHTRRPGGHNQTSTLLAELHLAAVKKRYEPEAPARDRSIHGVPAADSLNWQLGLIFSSPRVHWDGSGRRTCFAAGVRRGVSNFSSFTIRGDKLENSGTGAAVLREQTPASASLGRMHSLALGAAKLRVRKPGVNRCSLLNCESCNELFQGFMQNEP